MKSHNIPLDGLMSGNTRVMVVDADEAVGDRLCEILQEQTQYEVRSCSCMFQAGVEAERFARLENHVVEQECHDDRRVAGVALVEPADPDRLGAITGRTGTRRITLR